ncbi:MAG: HD domain-containing protein [Muribaculaceae bacterium]|nr:HD domain-containing protein [Muribaculaceae bacterium]
MKEISLALRTYIEKEIIPRYDKFDAGHRRDHVLVVIEQSLNLAQYYDVDVNMVYAIAAYHDTGLIAGREQHHIVSGEIVHNDGWLREWFDAKQIEIIIEAVVDHRASNSQEPRSIYGKIVAEADRIIDEATIVRRTIQYGLAHYPEYDKEMHYVRFVEHMKEKYAEGGYLKLWIPQSPNAERLHEFQQKIKEPGMLRALFDEMWVQL